MGFVVTIDGPAGVGKSTAARGLAARLGWFYLNSGDLYRAVAWNAVRLGLDPASAGDRLEAARDLAGSIRLERDDEGLTRLLVGDVEPGDALRTDDIAEAASVVARDVEVRNTLLPVQKAAARGGSVVAEGRDMGTVVFPDADVKFFVDADVEVRARRRALEFRQRGRDATYEEILEDMRERDERDRMRAVSPLRPAGDAVEVDTSAIDAGEVIARLVAHVEARIPEARKMLEDER